MGRFKQSKQRKHCHRTVVALALAAVCAGFATLVGQSTELLAEPIVRACTIQEPLNARRPPPLAFSPEQIRGFVTSPRLSTVHARKNPRRFALTFSGSVNAHPDSWHIEVDALRSAGLNPHEEGNWDHVKSIDITGGGPTVFTFSEAGIRPFEDLAGAWKPGGLGRLRVVAAMNADRSRCAFLPALDRDGLPPANAATIVVADRTVDPAKPKRQTGASIRDPFNPHTPNHLSANRRMPSWFFPTTPEAEPARLELQKQTTADYYRAIGTDPDGTGRSIKLVIPTLDDFIEHYFLRPFECLSDDNEPEQMATYFNKGDLGIGREMHCIYRACTAELACYVKNFARINRKDGKPIFGSKAKAKQALQANLPFATVAMVERGIVVERGLERQQAGLPDLPNGVFFVVYDANGDLLEDGAQLDNKGFNTSIPGNCLQCHGINSSYLVDGSRIHQVTNAMFLPFDLDVFQFFSNDEDDPLSRAYQEPAFRAFNRMVLLRSALGRSTAAIELIEGWYDGDPGDDAGNTFREFVPDGWQNAVDSQGNPDIRAQLHQLQLYRKFVAVGCRGCHISAVFPGDPEARHPRSFSRHDHFLAQSERVQEIVCRPSIHSMPAAEQTLKVLWRSEGRQHFFGQVPGAFGDCRP